MTRMAVWLAAVCWFTACDRAGRAVTPDPDRPTAIVVRSGGEQVGEAGEPLPERLGVRVTNAFGEGIPAAEVHWTVTSGEGRVLERNAAGDLASAPITYTRIDGSTDVLFAPSQLGRSTVSATVAGLNGAAAMFTADATRLVIQNSSYGEFLAPDGSRLVRVPASTPVEWSNVMPATARIVSTAAPAGMEGFDALLPPGERIEFVPLAPGIWEWTYFYLDGAGEISWGPAPTGTLQADP
jgi:hypothetical protein